MRPAAGAAALVLPETQKREVLDHRDCSAPAELLTELYAQYPWLTVWAEGRDGKAVNGNHRLRLGPAETLVIWGCPPGVEVLDAVLRRVEPVRVVLFGCGCEMESGAEFLAQLAGMVKYALSARKGRIDAAEIAAVVGHREVTVKRGLALLEAQGLFRTVSAEHLVLYAEAGGSRDGERAATLRGAVLEALQETAAYRRFFLRGDKDRVLAGTEPGGGTR
jgi:hypothetical protein